MYIVKCSVPTGYQYSSISNLMGGGNVVKSANGSYYAHLEFDTLLEAEYFLMKKLHILFQDTSMSLDELIAHKDTISKGYLSYDAATAHIEEVS